MTHGALGRDEHGLRCGDGPLRGEVWEGATVTRQFIYHCRDRHYYKVDCG